jgi:hypothetical protein
LVRGLIHGGHAVPLVGGLACGVATDLEITQQATAPPEWVGRAVEDSGPSGCA